MPIASAFADRFPERMLALKERYGEPGRYYHTWKHIETMRRHFAAVWDLIVRHEAVELAIYYHDAIYQPLASDNEVKSAELLREELEGMVDPVTMELAVEMIRATETHTLPTTEAESVSADCSYFLDIDIAIFGAKNTAFDQYERQIRQEYAAVPDNMFRTGRRNILAAFMERETIYFTEFFRKKYEVAARANLERSVRQLA